MYDNMYATPLSSVIAMCSDTGSALAVSEMSASNPGCPHIDTFRCTFIFIGILRKCALDDFVNAELKSLSSDFAVKPVLPVVCAIQTSSTSQTLAFQTLPKVAWRIS